MVCLSTARIKEKERTISRLTREVECGKKRPVGLKVWRS